MQFFLNQHYWPKLGELLSRNTLVPAQIKPYEHLSKSTQQMMNSTRVSHWLKLLSVETDCKDSNEAPFSKRMEVMGYGKMIPLKAFETTAAQYYFGPVNTQLKQSLNKLWAVHIGKKIKQARTKKKNQATPTSDTQMTVAF